MGPAKKALSLTVHQIKIDPLKEDKIYIYIEFLKINKPSITIIMLASGFDGESATDLRFT